MVLDAEVTRSILILYFDTRMLAMHIDITAKTIDIFHAFFTKQGREDIAESIENRRSWLRGDNTDAIGIPAPSLQLLEDLRALCKENGNRSLMMQCTSLINMIKNPNSAVVGSLKALPLALMKYIENDAIDGWLYQEHSGFNLPYLITNISYKPGEKGRNGDAPAQVQIELVANVANTSKDSKQLKRRLICFTHEDIAGNTIPSLLLSQGLHHETPELKAEYDANNELFKAYFAADFQQFLVKDMAFSTTSYDAIGKAFDINGGLFKVINDEPMITRKFYRELNNKFWEDRDISSFTQIPFHPLVYCFFLEMHEHAWAHVTNMTPYVYKPELRDKLILPEDHKDLIDILTSDLSLLSDIVEGKSGGTSIMCSGKPGTGKTLTAEIYSEVIQKPLYRVHSGLLGTTPAEVERQLQVVLTRAQRWQCCLLIDECDTWVRQRGNDIQQNAIVAAFLRTLEYYSGLLFLTTNRSDDIDDAILSRCIAHIKYVPPKDEQRNLLWATLSKNYNAQLTEETILDAIEKWPDVVGRDIKELLKLALKFASKSNACIDMAILTRCAQFRGL